MKTLAALILAFAWAAAAAQEALPAPVLRALQAANIPAQAVAVVVQPVDGTTPTLRHRAEAPMNPASLMKLVTTLAALETLGPAFAWQTGALAVPPAPTFDATGGVLYGDLFLRGNGDPKFTHERLWLLLRELRGRGLRDIRGDLVLDRAAFAPVEHDPAAFDGKPLRPYNVGPDPLLFNFASVHLTLLPEGEGVRVLAEPLPAGTAIDNRLRAVEARSCPADWRDRLTAQVSPQRIVLSGDYPRACNEKRWNLAGLPNASLLAGSFARLWGELGGSFSGRVREGSAPKNAVTLAVAESPPLAEVVRDINKFSNNVMAWQLFLTLGANRTAAQAVSPPTRKVAHCATFAIGTELGVGGQKVGAGPSQADAPPVGGSEPGLRAWGANQVGAGETATADREIRDWLKRKGLDFPELVIDNGSGLSRTTRISADSLTRLLAAGWASPVMPELIASLPVTGTDGTTKKRFNGNGITGRAHLKTGSLDGVRGIAGYLLDRAGRRHIVVFMVNHANAAQAQPAFDALLESI